MPRLLLHAVALGAILAILATNSLWSKLANLPFWDNTGAPHRFAFVCGVVFVFAIKHVASRVINASGRVGEDKTSIYGLDHGRLHLKLPDCFWMNMGYWRIESDYDSNFEGIIPSKTLQEASRDLLIQVFATAGVNRKRASSEVQRGIKKPTCVIDLGFGCGDQTACMMGTIFPDKEHLEPGTEGRFTGEFGSCFENYVGLTLDKKQYEFAVQRIRPSRLEFGRQKNREHVKIDMFCADAAKPELWSAELKQCVQETIEKTQECWILALDTAYHFSPSRWPVIKHACQDLRASFAAFDLCVSPMASFQQKLMLRFLTSLMGAPWENFVTPDEYRKKLIEVGYDASGITIRDISEDVFGPLAAFLEQKDQELRIVGLGIGPFNVARLMFRWWARSGVVRGIIVAAKQTGHEKPQ